VFREIIFKRFDRDELRVGEGDLFSRFAIKVFFAARSGIARAVLQAQAGRFSQYFAKKIEIGVRREIATEKKDDGPALVAFFGCQLVITRLEQCFLRLRELVEIPIEPRVVVVA